MARPASAAASSTGPSTKAACRFAHSASSPAAAAILQRDGGSPSSISSRTSSRAAAMLNRWGRSWNKRYADSAAKSAVPRLA